LEFTGEARWLQFATDHLQHLFPHGCGQSTPRTRHELSITIISAGESPRMSIVACMVIGHEQVSQQKPGMPPVIQPDAHRHAVTPRRTVSVSARRIVPGLDHSRWSVAGLARA
jgi:hypothetical protein